MSDSKSSSFHVSAKFQKMEKILTLNPTVFEPCHGKVDWEWSWRKLKCVKFALHLNKHGKWNIIPLSSTAIQDYQAQELKSLRERIETIKILIERLSKDVATKEDLKRTETLLVKNQEKLQTMLEQNMEDLRKTLGKDIEKKIGKKRAESFWKLLEKVATISDIIEFAKHVKDLLIFLQEQSIIQIALPFILKMIFG